MLGFVALWKEVNKGEDLSDVGLLHSSEIRPSDYLQQINEAQVKDSEADCSQLFKLCRNGVPTRERWASPPASG